jgi:hypothetical protein
VVLQRIDKGRNRLKKDNGMQAREWNGDRKKREKEEKDKK